MTPIKFYGKAREVLLQGKAKYGWPCTNQFISAPFYIKNIIKLFFKTSYLNEEVNCTEASSLVSIPWLSPLKIVFSRMGLGTLAFKSPL